MPHQCTNCGHAFADGSKEMLSGCPDCGGNKFQFKPSTTKSDSQSEPDSIPTSASADTKTPDATTTGQSSPPETEGVDRDSEVATEDQSAGPSTESPAQSTARSDVASSSEFTAAGSFGPQSESPDESTEQSESSPESDHSSEQLEQQAQPEQPAQPQSTESFAESSAETATETASDADPEESNLDQLRKELNNQFESIRIVNPGQYELNLMELYDRDEYIISLREDGRYVIEVPDGWGDSERA